MDPIFEAAWKMQVEGEFEYWAARNHREEHAAYVKMLRGGAFPSYGEDAGEGVCVAACQECPK